MFLLVIHVQAWSTWNQKRLFIAIWPRATCWWPKMATLRCATLVWLGRKFTTKKAANSPSNGRHRKP